MEFLRFRELGRLRWEELAAAVERASREENKEVPREDTEDTEFFRRRDDEAWRKC